jgi:hypothetical protein
MRYSGAASTLLERLRNENGIEAGELTDALNTYFQGPRSSQEVDDFRLGRGAFKKLEEEVCVVDAWRRSAGLEGRFAFPMDSHIPDCRWHAGQRSIGLEVTTALGRAGHR